MASSWGEVFGLLVSFSIIGCNTTSIADKTTGPRKTLAAITMLAIVLPIGFLAPLLPFGSSCRVFWAVCEAVHHFLEDGALRKQHIHARKRYGFAHDETAPITSKRVAKFFVATNI